MFRPMLACSWGSDEILQTHLENQGFMLLSPKLDGIRCLCYKGVAYTRRGRMIRNSHIQMVAHTLELHNIDGEIISGPANHSKVYNKTVTVVNSFDCGIDQENWVYNIFDKVSPDNFVARYTSLVKELPKSKHLVMLPQRRANTIEDVHKFEHRCITSGYEGIIIKSPWAPYKHGRSTANEGWMLKMKRIEDAEAIIIGFTPFSRNENEQVVNSLGYAERSKISQNLVELDSLGALIVKDICHGWEFNIGSGFTQADRDDIWKNRKDLLGKTITYKYLPYGMIDVPRHPIFKSFRED